MKRSQTDPFIESKPPVERRPVDVTSRRMTPWDTMIATPSPNIARTNGGVPWIQAEWRHRGAPLIPNNLCAGARLPDAP